jgi:transcriptional regulator with XRE-family HTH domain
MRRKNEQTKKLRVKVIEDKKNGLTYEDIRKKRGVSPSTIAQWTKGKDLKRYCKSCGESDPKKLEKHHPNKEKSPEHTVTLCANCHSKITRKQLSDRDRTRQSATVSKTPQALPPKVQPTPLLLQSSANLPNQVIPTALQPFTPKERAEIAKWALYIAGSIVSIEAVFDNKLVWWERLALLVSAGFAFRTGEKITHSSPNPKIK